MGSRGRSMWACKNKNKGHCDKIQKTRGPYGNRLKKTAYNHKPEFFSLKLNYLKKFILMSVTGEITR